MTGRAQYDRSPLESRAELGWPVEAVLSRHPPRGISPGMEIRVGEVVVHYVEHGTGRPVLVLPRRARSKRLKLAQRAYR